MYRGGVLADGGGAGQLSALQTIFENQNHMMQEAYRRVHALVRARGAMGGVKAYMWASQEGQSSRLRLFLDLPSQSQTW